MLLSPSKLDTVRNAPSSSRRPPRYTDQQFVVEDAGEQPEQVADHPVADEPDQRQEDARRVKPHHIHHRDRHHKRRQRANVAHRRVPDGICGSVERPDRSQQRVQEQRRSAALEVSEPASGGGRQSPLHWVCDGAEQQRPEQRFDERLEHGVGGQSDGAHRDHPSQRGHVEQRLFDALLVAGRDVAEDALQRRASRAHRRHAGWMAVTECRSAPGQRDGNTLWTGVGGELIRISDTPCIQ